MAAANFNNEAVEEDAADLLFPKGGSTFVYVLVK